MLEGILKFEDDISVSICWANRMLSLCTVQPIRSEQDGTAVDVTLSSNSLHSARRIHFRLPTQVDQFLRNISLDIHPIYFHELPPEFTETASRRSQSKAYTLDSQNITGLNHI